MASENHTENKSHSKVEDYGKNDFYYPCCEFTNDALARYSVAEADVYTRAVSYLCVGACPPTCPPQTFVGCQACVSPVFSGGYSDGPLRLTLLVDTLKQLKSLVARSLAKLANSKCNEPCCKSAADAIVASASSVLLQIQAIVLAVCLTADDGDDSPLAQHIQVLICSFETVLKTILSTVTCPKEKCKSVCVHRVEKRHVKKCDDKKKHESCSDSSSSDDESDFEDCKPKTKRNCY